MAKTLDNRAFTLAEIMVAATVGVFMIGVLVSFYYLANRAYSLGSPRQVLQNEANLVITKIIEGKVEPAGVFRLSEAVTYNIAAVSELHFVCTDGIERWFRLNGSSTSLIYHHPTVGGSVDEIVYTVPAGATITLRFSIPSGPQYTGVVLNIDAAITQNVSGSAVSGSVSTYVNIRNHAV